MQYIFLDTNIFIHFIDFEQIDWKTAINSNDKIVITLAPVVIDELDKHKYNKNQKISKKVKKILPKIESYIDNPTLCKYEFKYISSKPTDNTFKENSLNRNEQDDNLLATVIEFSKSVSKQDKIVYVTNDVGPRLKARSLNITALKISDEYLLAPEPDELESKNISLQKELIELKNRIPIVSLSFGNKENLILFKREKIVYSKQEFIAKELETEKNLNPYLIYFPPKSDSSNQLTTAFSQMNLSENQVNEYNSELDRYYDSYKEYAESLFIAFDFNVNSVEMQLVINNNGTSPADDIDIEIHFPDGFELFTKDELPKISKKPKLPYKPKHRYDIFSSFILPSVAIPQSYQAVNFPSTDNSYPTIKKTNSYDVTYHLKSLKHNQSFNLEPLYAKFMDIHIAKGFTVDYRLIISNVPKIITGQMNVNFE